MLIAWPAWDAELFFRINGIDSGILTAVMRTVTNVDNWIPFLLAAIIGLLWAGRTRPRLFPHEPGCRKRTFNSRNPRIVLLCLIVSTGLADQICYHFKHTVTRARPFLDEEIGHLVVYRGDVHGNRSFPSAHSANSAALAVTVALAYPALAAPALIVAFAVGFSRIYLGVHYPLDVLTGWGIGISSAVLLWLLFRKMLSRQGLIGFTNRFRIRQPSMSGPLPESWEETPMVSADGYRMTGLFRRGGDELVMMVHGLHGDIRLMIGPGDIFAAAGASVLAVPLRGHDGHPVPVTSGGPSEVYDVLGALKHADFLGYSRNRIIIYGSSMGGAAALKVTGLLDIPVAGVIAHGSYADFFGASRARLGAIRTWLLRMLIPRSPRNGLDHFRPLEYTGAASAASSVVFIHGSRDRISPVSSGREAAVLLPADH